ncbi:MAG TPA: beta-ketoacyl-ACP synthase III [Haliangiales bacterium]|nr:beta-ketoacyl-ACP synthase III [Haliangiales bacterium]
MIRTRILGTGRGVPPKVLTNHDLEKLVDTSDAWISERTGIRERRVLDESLTTSDLSAEAARNALDAAGVAPSELDCILVGTVTPDMPMPASAVILQKKLGAGPCPAFDLSAACAGFIYGLGMADAFIRGGQYRRVLVVGVEILTRVLEWTDRNTCVLFGDGAGAVVLGPEEDGRGLYSTHLQADGNLWEALYQRTGGKVKMAGRQVFSQAVKNISSSCMITLDHNGKTAADVDLVVAHQANLRILEAVAHRCGLPMSKFYLNIHKYGNTSSASIPIALDEAVRDGTVSDGMTILMCALGAGLSWGSALYRW